MKRKRKTRVAYFSGTGMNWPDATVQIVGWICAAIMVYSCTH